MNDSPRRSLTEMLRSFLAGPGDRAPGVRGERTSGPPRSSNGASSFHLWWEMPPTPLLEVSVVLEVLEPPRVQSLYFWALQVDFLGRGGSRGGGHTGLQWYPRFPGGTAVNWGGYASSARGGGILPGSRSPLPGLPDEANTHSYPWLPRRAYRLRVYRSPERAAAWRAEIADVLTGRIDVIRDLFIEAEYLVSPLVWSEVFADCDAPKVTVRWSDFQALDQAGMVIRPAAVRVSYQSFADGGCSNTNVVRDDDDGRVGVLQVTSTARATPDGSRLPL